MQDIIFHNITEKSHFDERGWVANPFLLPGFPNKFGHLHMVSMNPGKIRGNHFHRTIREWFFVFGGEYIIKWGRGDNFEEKIIHQEQMYVIEIPPGVKHTIKNISGNVIYLLAFQHASMEEIGSDTEKSELMEP